MKLKSPRQLIAMLALAFAIVIAVAVVAVSTGTTPDFYAEMLKVPASQSQQDGLRLERRLVELSNRIRNGQQWSTVLTTGQINGWLASDLPEKFPHALPPSVRQPRVAIAEGEFRLVFRFASGWFSGVVQVAGEIFATTGENQIAFRISGIRSGFLRLPVSLWARPLETSLRSRDVLLEWSESDGDPVALVTLPAWLTGGTSRQSRLEAIQITDQGIGLSGRTVHRAQSPAGSGEVVAGTTDRVQH